MNHRLSLAGTVLGVTACAVAAGCLLAPPAEKVRDLRAAYLPNHTVDVRGVVVTLENLPARLKSIGAVSSTTIRITIPGDLPKEAKEQIIRTMAAAGLPHVFLVSPRRATAYVGTERPAPAKK